MSEITIDVYNHYSILKYETGLSLGVQGAILRAINDTCSGSYVHFYGRVQKEAVERTVPLFRPDINAIPTGLLWEFVDMIENQVSVDVVDLRSREVDRPQFYSFPDYELDEKQLAAINAGVQNRRGYFKAATGAGKTSIMAGLIGELGGTSLVLAPSIDLVDQIGDDLKTFLQIPITKIIGVNSLFEAPESNVLVASIDTLWSNFERLKACGWFDQFNSFYGDEIHHATFTKEKVKKEGRKIVSRTPPGTTGYYKIMMAMNAYNRFGFTATDEGSELYIRAATGKKLIDIDEDYLISIGRLSRPYVILLHREVPFYEDEREATKNNIYLDEERNQALIKAMETVKELGGTTLFMLDSKKYQLKLIQDWTHFPVLTGETKMSERKEVYDKLRDKKISGIILTVGKEGLNIPSVDCIIRASGKKSIRLVKQEKGRGARATQEKNRYLVIDTFEDDGHKAIRKPNGTFRTKRGHLKKQSEKRLEIYSKTKSTKIVEVYSEEELCEKIKELF